MTDKELRAEREAIEREVTRLRQMTDEEIQADIGAVRNASAALMSRLTALKPHIAAAEERRALTKARNLAKRGMQEAAGANRG